jgi:translation initiation factor 2 alpha subunit (eIF-2alpha)
MADEAEVAEEVAEETIEVATEETSTTTTQETEKAFVDSMLESITDEDLKSSKMWDNLKGKDANEFAKYVSELKSFTGKKGDIPKEGASEDEWNAFYEKLGRPDSVEGYDFELNDDFKAIVGDESLPYYEGIVGTIQEQAFKLGASSEQAEQAVDSLLSLVAEQTEATNKALNEQTEANINALKTEFGDGYDAINDGIVALLENNGMTSEQADYFKESGVLSEPSLAIPLAKIAAKFADDPEIGHHQTTTQSGIQDQISEVQFEMQTFLKSGDKIPDHLLTKRNELFAKLK